MSHEFIFRFDFEFNIINFFVNDEGIERNPGLSFLRILFLKI